MKLIQKYLTKSGCYRVGRKIAVKGLMIHTVEITDEEKLRQMG